MNIAIYARSSPENANSGVEQLFRLFTKKNSRLFFYKPYHDFLKDTLSLPANISTFATYQELKSSGIDYMCSLGGDGTILETLTFIRNTGIPILGINTGRLGFLATVSKEETDFAIEALYDRRFTLDKRTLLRLDSSPQLFGELNFALNEITVLKKDSSTMIMIHAYLNGEFLNSYWADGLIISTPTGSTAYSLSCGGPILLPETHNIAITPIAPHNLNVRPIVVPDSSELSLTVEGRSPQYLVSLDSRTASIDSSIELKIKKEAFTVSLVRLENQHFLTTLRNKLMWGADRRSLP